MVLSWRVRQRQDRVSNERILSQFLSNGSPWDGHRLKVCEKTRILQSSCTKLCALGPFRFVVRVWMVKMVVKTNGKCPKGARKIVIDACSLRFALACFHTVSCSGRGENFSVCGSSPTHTAHTPWHTHPTHCLTHTHFHHTHKLGRSGGRKSNNGGGCSVVYSLRCVCVCVCVHGSVWASPAEACLGRAHACGG
jgi:hypothetical protein